MYAKLGLVSTDACAAFDSIIAKGVVSWNEVIAVFSENKLMSDAFRLFRLMQEMSPIYNALVSFYLRVGLIEPAELLFYRMVCIESQVAKRLGSV
ncbi:unnamed protein product [Linum trigynum]|uniref:Pentatricopeptide repeat-containing protein n=1 Tax=Linum trigynum TaxID=586398 RepID=A0AAV2D2A9_9ROSI